jgi:hypothetical protein
MMTMMTVMTMIGKFVVRCDSDLLRLFDDVWKVLKFKSRNDFLKFLMARAVDETYGTFATFDAQELKELLLKECETLIETRIYSILERKKS